jgi:hypothetical protein
MPGGNGTQSQLFNNQSQASFIGGTNQTYAESFMSGGGGIH